MGCGRDCVRNRYRCAVAKCEHYRATFRHSEGDLKVPAHIPAFRRFANSSGHVAGAVAALRDRPTEAHHPCSEVLAVRSADRDRTTILIGVLRLTRDDALADPGVEE